MLVATVYLNESHASSGLVRYGFDDGSGKITGNRWPEKEGEPPFECVTLTFVLQISYPLMSSLIKGHLDTFAFSEIWADSMDPTVSKSTIFNLSMMRMKYITISFKPWSMPYHTNEVLPWIFCFLSPIYFAHHLHIATRAHAQNTDTGTAGPFGMYFWPDIIRKRRYWR